MRRRLAVLACVLAVGCSRPNAPTVSPGDVLETYDPKLFMVSGWKDVVPGDGEEIEFVEIEVGTRVRFIDSGRQIRGGKRECVWVMEGPERGSRAYFHRSFLRPVPR